MPTPLTSNPVTELTNESAVKASIQEWLRRYFDGGSHSVGNNAPVAFPKAAIGFDAGPPPQALGDAGGLEIRLIMLPRSETSVPSQNFDALSLVQGQPIILVSSLLTRSFRLLLFQLRTKVPGAGKSNQLADQGAQLLHALLNNPTERSLLATNGVMNLKPRSVQPMDDGVYIMRVVACQCEVEYPTISSGAISQAGGGVPGVIPPGTQEQKLQWVREQPLVTGAYLIGLYEFRVAITATQAQAIGWASQGVDTLLGLEVNGALTGDTLDLPAGAPGQEVSTGVITLNRPIPAGANIRWKVLNGPSTADAMATNCAVMMTVQVQNM